MTAPLPMTFGHTRQCFAILFALFWPLGATAQRAFEAKGNVVYEDARGVHTNLGRGFSPVLIDDGRVVFVRGRSFEYGEKFDCANGETRDWVAAYDPATRKEAVLFDRAIPFEGGRWNFCVFEQMQVSPDGSALYLVSAVYATSGSLAIVSLPRGSVIYVPGVMSVYVIETGPHRGELIYQRRVSHRSSEDGLEYPAYPFIHARADGQQIREISDEHFTSGGNDKVPLLRAYLRKIGGTITANGQKLP